MSNEITDYELDLSKLNAEVKELAENTATLKTEQAKLNDAYKNGKVTEDKYKASMQKLNQQLEANKQKMKQVSDVIKTKLNDQMAKGLDKADGLGQAFEGVSHVMQGDLFGAIGQIKAAFSALGGPIGIITAAIGTLLASMLPLKEMGEAISNTFSKWGRDFKVFFGLEDALDGVNNKVETFEEHLEKVKEKMEKIKSHAEDVKNAVAAWNDVFNEQLKAEENQFMVTGDQNNLIQAGEEYAKILRNQNKETDAELKSIQAQMDAITNMDEEGEKYSKLLAEQEKVYKQWMSDTEIEVKVQEYQKSLQQQYNDKLKEAANKEKGKGTAAKKTDSVFKSQLNAIREQTEELKTQIDLLSSQGLRKQLLEIDVWRKKELTKIANERAQAEKELKDNSITQDEYNKELDAIKMEEQTVEMFYNLRISKAVEANNKILQNQAEVLEKSIEAATKAADNAARDLATTALEGKALIQEQGKNAIADLNEQERIELDAANKDAELQYQITRKYDLLKEKSRQETDAKIIAYDKEVAEREKQNAQQMADAYANAVSAVGNLFGQLSETMEEGSDEWYAMELMQIIMSEAASIAQGIQKAISTSSNWIEAVAAAAGVAAEVVGLFTQVHNLRSQAKSAKSGYAKGGIVVGEGSGTSDSIQTNVSNGESIINAKATSLYAPLLDALNRSTGGAAIQTAANSNAFTRQLSQALMAMPNPIVTVKSINQGTDTYNRITGLRSI